MSRAGQTAALLLVTINPEREDFGMRLTNLAFRALILFVAIGGALAVFNHFAKEGYEGTVSGTKLIRSGLLVDLDGHFPGQGMVLVADRTVATQIGHNHPGWCSPGAKIGVSGRITDYQGHPEIVVESPSQIVSLSLVSDQSSASGNDLQTEATDNALSFFPPPAVQRITFALDWIVLAGICVSGVGFLALLFLDSPEFQGPRN